MNDKTADNTNTSSELRNSQVAAYPFVMRGPEHMKEAVAYLQEYMNTYINQPGYKSFSAQTLVDDVLYGLGVALDKERHTAAQGYRAFKEKLKAHLGA